ncbi:MAG: RecQ family ATP-dependent DNA helicase [Rikenellaceae bacterium]|nr:RecQ family ATP-dependent DNA helicase [Rikenellaceae bacterium]
MSCEQVDILATLHKWWGYEGFREGQQQVIEAVVGGRDTLALMPTGAGKSLLYQVPTMAREGLCIVVTPLVALMKDQVDALRRRGINAVAIHSGLTQRAIDIALDNCVYGDVKFLYIAPERIPSEMMRLRVPKMKVQLIAVDEAHCISQWGYDFRPSYLRIKELRALAPEATVLALTASATPSVAEDIMSQLEFGEPHIIRSDFSRPNISFVVRLTYNKSDQLCRILESVSGSAIVYVRTREGCEKVANYLREKGFDADYYHAGMPHEERSIRQDAWLKDQLRIIVATSAFGMGIDKRDVRVVVHYDMCDSMEAYYQEAGRAGRDGGRSFAVLLMSSDEISRCQNRIDNEFPPIKLIKNIYNDICSSLMVAYGEGGGQSFQFNIYDFCTAHHLSVQLVRNAIKLLTLNGYMTLSDEGENSARVMFCVSREDLYDYRIRKREMEGVLLALLRLYEGIFTEFKPIDVQEIAHLSGYTDEVVREQLKILWQQHIIRYVPRSFTPLLTLLCDRVPKHDVFIDSENYRARKRCLGDRLNAMCQYALLNDGCRSRYIQEYFGQSDATDCGCCDLCIDRRKGRVRVSDQDDNQTEPTPQVVLKLLTDRGPMSVPQLVANFSAWPDEVVEIVGDLIADHKIYTDKLGKLRKK